MAHIGAKLSDVLPLQTVTAARGHVAIVERLLEAGADVERDDYGRTGRWLRHGAFGVAASDLRPRSGLLPRQRDLACARAISSETAITLTE